MVVTLVTDRKRMTGAQVTRVSTPAVRATPARDTPGAADAVRRSSSTSASGVNEPGFSAMAWTTSSRRPVNRRPSSSRRRSIHSALGEVFRALRGCVSDGHGVSLYQMF